MPSSEAKAAGPACTPSDRSPITSAGRPGRRDRVLVARCEAAATPHADYQAKAGDSAVLQRPLKSELLPEEIHNVFGYPRNLKDR